VEENEEEEEEEKKQTTTGSSRVIDFVERLATRFEESRGSQ